MSWQGRMLRGAPPFALFEGWVVAKRRTGFSEIVYRRPFLSSLLLAGVPCFAFCALPALVFERDCSYISIHFALEMAEISLPIAGSGRSSGDWKWTQHFPMSSFFLAALNAAFNWASWLALQNAPIR